MPIGDENDLKIGISMSGGGIRALVFHLGVLKWLSESASWNKIETISTVSGGSLAIALIISSNNGDWPSSEEFNETVLPKAKATLTSSSIQAWYIFKALIWFPRLFRGRANLIAKIIEKKWGVTQSLQNLPDRPKILINCTTYETGKNWRFLRGLISA